MHKEKFCHCGGKLMKDKFVLKLKLQGQQNTRKSQKVTVIWQ